MTKKKQKQKMREEVLLLVESIANERGVDKEEIFTVIEGALAAVAARRYDEEHVLMRVSIDRETGNYDTSRIWNVVSDDDLLEMPAQQVPLTKAKSINPELELGDVIEEEVESPEFGRIAIQQVKQAILQKVREIERQKIAKQYDKRVGQLVIGVVKRVTRDFIILDMGDNAEGLMLREEMIPREAFRVNDRLRAYLYEVREDRRGPQLLVSRTRPEFLIELFTIEVPEIGQEVIQIKAAARDPGSRAKIAVKTNDGRIDPIGACVGMRGSRVQAVSNELNGERIDIILWDDNPAQLVINAMAPAEVASIVVDEDTHTMDIAVTEERLSQAIGRSGQNVRLASELTGWTLNVMNEQDAQQKQESEASKFKSVFMEKLDVDEDVAEALVQEGFTSLEELAYVPLEEIKAIEGFDATIAEELRRRASDILLTQELTSESAQSANDLLKIEGMDDQLASELTRKGIATRDDLAELSVDELKDVIEIDNERAAKLIMAAREHWFTE